MKYYSRDLLTLLISLFILSGCTNPSLVGLDINPDDQIQGQFDDSQAIQTYIAREDSIMTTGAGVSPFGYLKDPILGESSSSIALTIAPLQTGDSRFPLGITIDSAVLVMNYYNEFFGDSLNSSYNVEVRQLKNPYIFGKAYYSTEKWEVMPDVIGSKSLNRFAYKDSVKVSQQIDGKDTSFFVAPQLRIPMNAAALSELFKSSHDSTVFANEDNFNNILKGFYISVNKSTQAGIGGIATMAINSDMNGLEIYYKLPDSTKQSLRRYAISSNQSATAMEHVFSADVTSQLSAADKDQPVVYTEGLGGLKTVVKFPDLESLRDKNLVINKAELVIYVDSDKTGSVFTNQASRLTAYRKDIAGQRMPIPDGDTRAPSNNQNIADPRSFGLGFGGFYNKDKKRYLFTLTSYIQDIVQGRTQNKELYITSASDLELGIVPYLPTTKAISRAVLGGGNGTQYKMKLNIYYSKINF